ncbi:LysR family transcriptional regulator [Enterococcus asini]|uniref:LysR family transcriptional regulator n=1 Tax=Enterococcus asini TaxID=57732 RepID=UPI00289106D7|nr:LysR family transcriptional regulator [Enterococcus asini]MDT2757901.1 LysR family transcriptional regulator [Enterococcus asini]
MLDYHYLTFLTVCDTLSYTEAAKVLNLTQPAVSKHIAQLQEELGLTLFEYKQKRLSITAAGQYLYKLVSKMKKEGEVGLSSLFSDEYPLEINVGCTFTIGNYLISEPFSKLLVRFPNTHLNLQVENTRDLLHDLNLDRLDCGFVEGDFDRRAFQHRLFRKEPLICVCSPDNPLAKGVVDYPQLQNQRIIMRERGSGLGELVIQVLQRQGLFEHHLDCMHIGNYQVMKDFVEKNLGIAFLYASSVKTELTQKTLCQINFTEDLPAHEMFFIYRRENPGVEQIIRNFDLFEMFDN